MKLTKQERTIVVFLVGIFVLNVAIHFFTGNRTDSNAAVAAESVESDSLFLEKVARVETLVQSGADSSSEQQDSPEVEKMAEQRDSLKVNINLADGETLEKLPRIGPVMAKRIIAHRENYGYFTSIQDLQEVKGIGPATASQLKPHIIFKTTTPE
jgi:comEA protein